MDDREVLSPGKFIKPGDGPGVRRGKELLLSVRSDMLRRHRIALIMMLVGAPLGIGISTGIELLMSR